MQHIAGSLVEGSSKLQLALQELEEILSENSMIKLPQTVSMKRIAAGPALQEGNEDRISSSGTRGNSICNQDNQTGKKRKKVLNHSPTRCHLTSIKLKNTPWFYNY